MLDGVIDGVIYFIVLEWSKFLDLKVKYNFIFIIKIFNRFYIILIFKELL